LNVNYHAFKIFCEQQGGLALFPDHEHTSINIGCFVLVHEVERYSETRSAYQRSVQDFGPDDLYRIYRSARQQSGDMSVDDILAHLRLSLYDSHQCRYYLPRLLELAPTLDKNKRQAVTSAIEQVWKAYFPLREVFDLPYQIADLFYALEDYQHALLYFERSVKIYGPHTGTLYNMAVCHQLLGQHERAKELLQRVVRYDPENQSAMSLLAAYSQDDSCFYL